MLPDAGRRGVPGRVSPACDDCAAARRSDTGPRVGGCAATVARVREVLLRRLPGWRFAPPAGVSLCCRLPDGLGSTPLVAAAERQGLVLLPGPDSAPVVRSTTISAGRSPKRSRTYSPRSTCRPGSARPSWSRVQRHQV
ncbi:hypothetical protein QM787_07610 [Rhodococcus ruber]|uniref:hypothetical protein n=1 Tax=Rhodococcus TaxID=1827 RepID=UPI00058D815F|nr:hypothetical protein [Rhodococcus ruber]MDO2378029.1 hypothetical protein [Rhodococcus ruber]MCD2125976.1 hypothetical protein [Rhodococcus ruber]MCZ4502214.1 hypothetical protein [Rhodococcus ruber]MCZ4530043.1 hypothetical protein [Rhodococcus ruber]MCZ4620354.1 hypothetical protein [Rhodococcus ruber]